MKILRTKQHYSESNTVRLIKNGPDFINSNINLINNSNDFILLHTYIFEDDKSTAPILDALIQARKRGVSVFMLLDAIGSSSFPSKKIISLQDQGINCEFFGPVTSPWRNNLARRLHSKVLLCDGRHAIIGGINLGERFLLDINTGKPWLDYSVCVTGEEVSTIFKRILPLYTSNFSDTKQLRNIKIPAHDIHKTLLIRTLINDEMKFKREIYKSFIHRIRRAQSEIILLATYFLPGKKILKELRDARKRGVSVKLIFGEVSDVPFEKWANSYLYKWYLTQGLEIFIWNESILHGKLALFDQKIVSIGSYNHNFIGRYTNHELNLEINNIIFGKEVATELQLVMSSATKLDIKKWDIKNTWPAAFLRTFVFIISNIIFISYSFLLNKDKDSEN